MSKHPSPNQCHIQRCLGIFCENVLQTNKHKQTNKQTNKHIHIYLFIFIPWFCLKYFKQKLSTQLFLVMSSIHLE